MGKAHSAVTASVSSIRRNSSVRFPPPVRASNARNAGTIMTQAPMLKASTKDSAFTDRHARWPALASGFYAVTASPRASSTPTPIQPANTLGLRKMEVIRTPSSTAPSSM